MILIFVFGSMAGSPPELQVFQARLNNDYYIHSTEQIAMSSLEEEAVLQFLT
jgi:hypothetical protein